MLGEYLTHCQGCFFLHFVGCVGVGAQGEAWISVAQHTGDRSDVYAVLQGHGCEGVAQINGEWIMHGLDWDDPRSIKTWEELITRSGLQKETNRIERFDLCSGESVFP